MSRCLDFVSGRSPKPFSVRRGGFEIINGPQRFNRVLYGEILADQPHRIRFLAGDLPEILVHVMGDAGRLLLGAGLPGREIWLTRAAQVRALYRDGCMVYVIRDPAFGEGCLELTAAPLTGEPGLAVRIAARHFPQDARLVAAYGGASGRNNLRSIDAGYTGESFLALQPASCKDNQFEFAERGFSLAAPFLGTSRIWGAFSFPGSFRAISTDAYFQGPTQGSLPAGSPDAMALYEAELGGASFEGYLFLNYGATAPTSGTSNARERFERAVADRAKVAATACVSTPEPLWAASLAASCIAVNASWIAPVFLHGAWSWDIPILGWRSLYGPIALGWHDRVALQTRLFTGLQLTEEFTMANPDAQALYPVYNKDGDYFVERQGGKEYKMLPEADSGTNFSLQSYESILSSPGVVPYMPDKFNKPRYNMQEVFFDQVLQAFLWTGDREFLSANWKAIQRHLGWEKRCFDPDDDGLYESYSNFWASDAIWASGGGCALASAYNYRAHRLAAGFAVLMGEDPAPYAAQAEKIRTAVHERLWLREAGHLAEWVDILGNQQLHPSLSLPTIVHVVESGLLDSFEVYQLLRTTHNHLKREPAAEGGELIWNTNWVPYTWSIRDIDFADLFHAALGYFLNGQADEGYALLRAATSESTCHNVAPGGLMCIYEGKSVDFTDTSSMFVRVFIEGLFGIRPRLDEGRLEIAPGFPADWTSAALKLAGASLDYRRDGAVETFTITSARPCALRLRLPLRTAGSLTATINGAPAPVRRNAAVGRPMIELDGPQGDRWTVVVTSAGEALTPLAFPPVAITGQTFRITAAPGQELCELRDPQGVFAPGLDLGATALSATVALAPGQHTFFVQIRQGEAVYWQPVDLEIADALSVIESRLDSRTGAVCLRLRNATDTALNLNVSLGGETHAVVVGDGALSRELAFHPARALTPGSNTFRLEVKGDRCATLEFTLVTWEPVCPAERQSTVEISSHYNLRLADLFKQSYLSPRSPYCSISTPVHLFPSDWCRVPMDGVNDFNDMMLRDAVSPEGIFTTGCGLQFRQEASVDAANSAMVSLWDNFPSELEVPLQGTARKLYAFVAGYTNQMQCEVENAVIEIEYADGTVQRRSLVNPYDFRSVERGPDTERAVDDWCMRGKQLYRVPVGHIQNRSTMGFEHTLEADGATGQIVDVELADKPLRAFRLRAVANDVVLGLLGVTLLE